MECDICVGAVIVGKNICAKVTFVTTDGYYCDIEDINDGTRDILHVQTIVDNVRDGVWSLT